LPMKRAQTSPVAVMKKRATDRLRSVLLLFTHSCIRVNIYFFLQKKDRLQSTRGESSSDSDAAPKVHVLLLLIFFTNCDDSVDIMSFRFRNEDMDLKKRRRQQLNLMWQQQLRLIDYRSCLSLSINMIVCHLLSCLEETK
jgi:hypothetical protein